MTSQIPKEHIRHCMLFEFRNGSNATVAIKNICDVYPSALDVRKCQRWFSKFRSGNFDLSDSYRSGRPTTLDMLRAEVEANPCQIIEKLSNTFNQSWSTIQEHLQQIGKISRAGVWVPHNLSKENKANRSITSNVLLQRHHTEPFFDRLITGDEKWVLYIQNAKGIGSLQMNHHEVLRSRIYIPKRRFCVFGGVYMELFILKC
ncbi:histone-lysine N-methyltransferase SETMAR-like [Vespa velutina]|uniref:histone-lysine N-methyltransferase SETMAR-like n=1 Tax=Vespa velutina TaxID=202808 RepID=UPI001FB21F4D|nr:histone-lysine N-methyltransferase SETMAR-like [Vespa velutina]XP_047362137.1 histone-lysine N-methyltransferase SETMAR-like [Vespa velutina]